MHFTTKEIFALLSKELPNLSPKDIESFLNITTYHNLNKNEIILKSGIKTKKAFLILKGTVRGYIIQDDGIEKTTLIRSEGIFVADSKKLFYNELQKLTFKSVGEADVLIFHFKDFENLTATNPNIMQLYLNILKEAVVRLTYRVESLTLLSNEDRYKELLKLNPNFLKKTYAKHIASYLGITSVSLSRIMNRVKNKN